MSSFDVVVLCITLVLDDRILLEFTGGIRNVKWRFNSINLSANHQCSGN